MGAEPDRDEAAFWREVEAVFEAARELAGAERQAVLAARCGDARLREEVEALLEADRASGGFLEVPIVGHGPGDVADHRIGMRVGAFELVEQVGAGGMGVVYRARRTDGHFEQQVAVKLVNGRLLDAVHLARFDTERRILAQLHHPNVVSLIDGGVTPEGQPYLVMEHVDGLPITSFASRKRLDLDARVALFTAVCAAASHAHQHLVVHRDLKPPNVLVTTEGVVKVLDFGVAKLLSPDAATDATAPGALPGPLTLNYASPEQLLGAALSTSSDVYALGVLLCELLAGRRPYDVTDRPLEEVLRLVTEQAPPRCSALAATSSDLPYDSRALRGDLDAIVAKALAKSPDGRYATADELAADLGRWQYRRPVLAREQSIAYVVRRLAARHRAAFVVGGVGLVLLLGATGVGWWQAGVASRERTRAEARVKDLRELASSMIFRVHDAVTPLPGSTPVRRIIVEEALAFMDRLGADVSGDRFVQLEIASAYLRLGEVQGDPARANLGDREGARASFEKASRLFAAMATTPDAPYAVFEGYVSAARRLSALSAPVDTAGARAVLDAAAPYAERAMAVDGGSSRSRALQAHLAFSRAQLDTGAAAIASWERVLPLYDALLEEAPEDVTRIRNVALVEKYLGAAYDHQQQDTEAAAHYSRALELDTRRLDANPDDRGVLTDVAIDYANVATVADRAGRNQEAIALHERSYAIRQRLSKEDPQNVFLRGRLAAAAWRLSSAHLRAGHVGRAVVLATEAEAIDAQLATGDPRFVTDHVRSLFQLGQALTSAGQPSSACRAYSALGELLAGQATPPPDETPEARRILVEGRRHAEACLATGRPAATPGAGQR